MNYPAWLDSTRVDIACFVASVIALAAYHLYLRLRLKGDPAYTVQAVNTIARTAWVENVMAGGKDILAVQTLQLDPIYRKARQVEHWDTHFGDARAGFEAECEALRAGIAGLASRSA